MKNITVFLNESVDSNYCAKVLKAALTSSIVKSLIPFNGDQDPNRFEAQDQNAKTICDVINKSSKYRAIPVREFYKIETGKNPDNLSVSEWAKYDRENGDIIFIDDNNNPLCKIDLKVSAGYLGAVTLNSIMDFDKNGLYACCNLKTGDSKIVSHSDVKKLANKGLLTEPSVHKVFKGKSVKWNGKDVTTEYFIKGKDIENNI